MLRRGVAGGQTLADLAGGPGGRVAAQRLAAIRDRLIIPLEVGVDPGREVIGSIVVRNEAFEGVELDQRVVVRSQIVVQRRERPMPFRVRRKLPRERDQAALGFREPPHSVQTFPRHLQEPFAIGGIGLEFRKDGERRVRLSLAQRQHPFE